MLALPPPAALAEAPRGLPPAQERADLAAVFDENGIRGCFALYDVAIGRLVTVNGGRAATRMTPASTFKIANSLIALETGAVVSVDEVIPYDGRPQPFKTWEQDMGMRDAIRVSNVPFYQEIARRVGLVRYRDWLARLDYGSREVGPEVTTFWLREPLQISALEQVRFLAALAQGRLPASERSQAAVRDILRLETRGDATLYGKTGWRMAGEPQLGWWVGWVERGGIVLPFALNIDIHGEADAPKRQAIGKALLVKLGVYPSE